MVVNLSESHSLLSNWMSELRSSTIQQDRARFRRNLERLGEVAAYEISKLLPSQVVEIETPLGTHNSKILVEQPVLATILRAGIPMHNGMLNYFDNADNAFIAAYRKHKTDGSFEICLEYLSCPTLNDRILIVSDPMLATGASLAKTVQYLNNVGRPKEIYIVCAIASTVGIDYVERECGSKVNIFCGDIDDEITAKGYIVPGLGDAGDLAYGKKVQF